MNLYFIPGACSLAINIGLREANMQFILTEVDYSSRCLADGTDFRSINPKGYVPALRLGDGSCLSEIIAIFDYIDFRAPDAGLLGPCGTSQRRAAMESLTFVATEIHKSFSPLFRPETPASFLDYGLDHLRKRLSAAEDQLSRQAYLSGATPAAADFYLFVVCRWMGDVGLCLDDWPSISDHSARIGARDSVQCALASENLC